MAAASIITGSEEAERAHPDRAERHDLAVARHPPEGEEDAQQEGHRDRDGQDRGQQIEEDAEDRGEVRAAGHQHREETRDLVDEEDEGEDQQPDRGGGQHLADDVAVEETRPRSHEVLEHGHRAHRSTRPRERPVGAAARFRRTRHLRYRHRSAMDRVTCYAPGSTSNVGPGFDCLGIAIAGIGDRVVAMRTVGAGVRVLSVSDPRIPCDPGRNTAALAAADVLRRAGAAGVGLELRVEKGLPLSGGLGGSAASAVAGAFAANVLLGGPLGARGPPALGPRGRGRGRRPPPRQRGALAPGRGGPRPRRRAAALRPAHRPPVAAPRLRDPGLRRRDRAGPRGSPRERLPRRRGGAGLGPGRPGARPRARGRQPPPRGDGGPGGRARADPAVPGVRRGRARRRSRAAPSASR